MIILDCEQLSPEWFSARCGIPSASNFDKIVTSKGEPSKQQKNYLYQLAGEAITGEKVKSHQSAAMLRGIEMEPEARAYYEFTQGVDVQKVGLCYLNEDKKFSCSPDGLIGEDGGLEQKCPLSHTHISYILGKKLPTEYVAQVQGNLLVTGRKWWDFHSYFPGLPSLIIRVQRNEEFIKKLHAELNKFCAELEKTVRKLREL